MVSKIQTLGNYLQKNNEDQSFWALRSRSEPIKSEFFWDTQYFERIL